MVPVEVVSCCRPSCSSESASSWATYLLDPNPHPGQEGAEHGVRLELRVFDRGELKGTIYSATPIEVGRPIWRVDLLKSVDGKPGSFNRTHHHQKFTGWDPGPRVFLRELWADPLGWLAGQLADLPAGLERAGVPRARRPPGPEMPTACGR